MFKSLFVGLLLLCGLNTAQGQTVFVPQDQYVELNGVQLHYLDWGGKGPTMLMIHGLWQTAHWYDGLAPYYTDRYRVLGLTRREHGASQKDTGPLSVELLVDDIADFLRLFTVERAVLVGHSYAGIEIPQLAREHPDQVAAVILLDGVYDWPMWISEEQPPFPVRWGFPDRFASYQEMNHWYRATYEQIWGEALIVGLRSQSYMSSDGSVQWQLPYQSPKASEFLSLYANWSEDAFAGIGIPILSIQGDFTGFFKREFRRLPVSEKDRKTALTWAAFEADSKQRGREQLKRAAQHAEQHTLIDTHHWVWIQRPVEVREKIDEFLRNY